jgi:hypothetical protein
MKFQVNVTDKFPSLNFTGGDRSFIPVVYRAGTCPPEYHSICKFKNTTHSSMEFSYFMGLEVRLLICHLTTKTQVLISRLQQNLHSVGDLLLLVILQNWFNQRCPELGKRTVLACVL